MTSDEVIQKFLEFFQSRDHLLIPGAPLVPKDDPTLLFINSGMAPLKPYFLGQKKPPHPNLCDIQACIRTVDIDIVGDRQHLTMFEMMGSWSIGQYWKDQAIELAYDLLVNGFGYDPQKLYATVFSGSGELGIPPDEDSPQIWERVGFPRDHIVPLGEDNLWGPAGKFGPCGPCTEVFYDTGDAHGEAYAPGKYFDTENRYIEIWNAGVFMEYNKQPAGLEPLQLRSVDTGSGLERMLMNLNQVDSVYETDRLASLVQSARQQLGGGTDSGTIADAKVIADHVRAFSFILADGARPSNMGRGYIPRRLMRKVISIAMRHSLPRFELADLLELVILKMGAQHPRLKSHRANILQIFEQEQHEFSNRVRHGLERLATLCSKKPISLSGHEALSLFTTFGLPMEMIRDYVRERGGLIDEEGFQKEYRRHQDVSRAGLEDASEYDSIGQFATPTVYVGEETLATEGVIQALMVRGEFRDSVQAGQEAEIVVDRTPFYAESGGQIGDWGTISGASGSVAVRETVKAVNQYWIHRGKVTGTLTPGERVTLSVDPEYRRKVRANHSATHLLQSALRTVLGTHVQQAGSRVDPDKLRFDFQHPKKVTPVELRQVELLVNHNIRLNTPTNLHLTTYREAISAGALAFFGENYGETVRMVQFGDFSTELCGGSHVRATGDIALFRIASESSVSSGVRRIIAVTGEEALQQTLADRAIVESLSQLLQVPQDGLEPQVKALVAKSRQDSGKRSAKTEAPTPNSDVRKLPDGTPFVFAEVDLDLRGMREQALDLANRIGGIVCLVTPQEGRFSITVTVGKLLTSRYQADSIVKRLVEPVKGHGGGKPHLAQGGGSGVVDLSTIEANLLSIEASI